MSLRSLRSDFRLGEFNEVFDKLGLDSDTPSSLTDAYKNIYNDAIPDFKVSDAIDDAAKGKSLHPDLDVTGDAETLKNKLSDDSISKTEQIFNRVLKDYIPALGKFALYGIFGYGLFEAGSDIIDYLADYMNGMNGCTFVTTTSGKTSSCKLNSRTCTSYTQSNVESCASSVNSSLGYNIKILLYATLTDSTLKTDVSSVTGITVSDADDITATLADSTNVTSLISYLAKSAPDLTAVTPCTIFSLTKGCVDV